MTTTGYVVVSLLGIGLVLIDASIRSLEQRFTRLAKHVGFVEPQRPGNKAD